MLDFPWNHRDARTQANPTFYGRIVPDSSTCSKSTRPVEDRLHVSICPTVPYFFERYFLGPFLPPSGFYTCYYCWCWARGCCYYRCIYWHTPSHTVVRSWFLIPNHIRKRRSSIPKHSRGFGAILVAVHPISVSQPILIGILAGG